MTYPFELELKPNEEFNTFDIANIKFSICNKWQTSDKYPGCILWNGGYSNGYAQLKYNGKKWRVTRLLWALFHGPIPIDMQVLHSCDIKSCIQIEHLFLGTLLDNMLDKVSKGRQARGSTHGNSVLTEAQVLNIFKDTRFTNELIKEYNVSRSVINGIRRGDTWKHITQK